MSLIATNKISEYIDQHPEARVPLLSWLKEYPYHLGKRMFFGQDGEPHQDCDSGAFGIGRGDYIIKNRVNYSAKIDCIIWVGNKEAYQIEMDRELKEILQKYPDTVVKKVSTTLTIQAPAPQMTGISVTSELNDESIYVNSEIDLPEGEVFQTEKEYEEALARAAIIFEAKPNTSEFDELLALAPLIQYFENHKLKFPSLGNFEAVKRKMEILDMIPLNLAHLVGSEAQFNLFLSGELALSDEIVNRLFKLLFIRFPINDRRFIS